MADSTINIALLRKCGIPDWILVDDDWKEFIVFFKEYISEANILTDEELIEQDLLERNKNEHTASLTERMDDIAKQYDGIWVLTDDKISDAKDAIEIEAQKEEQFDHLIAKTKASVLDSIELLTILKGEKNKLLSDEPILTDECHKQLEELQEIRLSNERKICELGQLYSKSTQNPLFMHQMPLNEYFRQLEQFNENVKHFVQKNFKVNNYDDSNAADVRKQAFKTQMLNDLSVMADRLLNAYNKLCITEMSFNAKVSLTNQFKIQNWSPSTLLGMRREIIQMEHNRELNEGQKQHLMHKLQEQAIELSQLDIEALIFESNQKRMKRAKQRIDYMTQISNLVSEVMTLSELFWALIQLDLERMKNRTTFDSKLDTYRMESLGCSRRIEILNLIQKINNNQQIQRYFGSFIDLLQIDSRKFNECSAEEITKCCLLANELKMNAAKHAQRDVNEIGVFDSDKNEFFNKVSNIENIFYKHLFDGPVQRPLQTTEWYREKKTYLEAQLSSIITQNELKKGECSQYIKKWSNDKYWRLKQVLWVWFTTEPKKVLKTLKSISCEAALRSKNEIIATRHLAGIVRKK